MSKKRKGITIADRNRWIENWNKNKDDNYIPHINTRDFASLGNKHRAAGSKTNGRTAQLLSTNEYFMFLQLEFDPFVVSIEEQYLLPLDLTTQVANELEVKHPIYTRTKGNIKAPLTSDFKVGYINNQNKVISVKDSRDAEKNRTKEKQMIERAAWEIQGEEWEQVLDTQLKTNFSINLELLFPYRELSPANFYQKLLPKWLPNFIACMSDSPYSPLADVIEQSGENIDINFNMAKELFFNAVWHRHLTFDFNQVLGFELSVDELKVTPNACS